MEAPLNTTASHSRIQFQKSEIFFKLKLFNLWWAEKNSYLQKLGQILKRLGVPNPELLKFLRLDLKKVANF